MSSILKVNRQMKKQRKAVLRQQRQQQQFRQQQQTKVKQLRKEIENEIENEQKEAKEILKSHGINLKVNGLIEEIIIEERTITIIILNEEERSTIKITKIK